MQCEEVRTRLERDAVVPAVREAIETHLAGCPACRRVGRLYARIDQALQSGPLWEPPAGFARGVAARAVRAARESGGDPVRAARFGALSRGDVQAAVLGLLVALFAYLAARPDGPFTPLTAWLASDRVAAVVTAYERFAALSSDLLVVHATPLAWAFAALTLGLTAWLARRSLA